MAHDAVASAVRAEPFPAGTALALTAVAATSSALPDWVPDWRRRWPLQLALAGVGAAVFALRPDGVAPGGLTASDRATAGRVGETGPDGGDATPIGRADESTDSLPSTSQGLDQPDIPWSKVLLPGVLLLGAGLAGGLWLERQAIKGVSRCGASRPRTVLSLVSVPFLWWSLRQDLSEDTDRA